LPIGLALNSRKFEVDPKNVNICIMGKNELSKFVLVHAMKASAGMKIQLNSFLTLALNGTQWSTSLPSSLKSVISNKI
jgi:hypothetical protein